MFGGSSWIGSIGGLEDHTKKERDPPARPFSPEFPDYVPPFTDQELDAQSSTYLRDKLCRIRALTDISDADLARLNIKLTKDVDASILLPTEQFSQRPFLFDDELDQMLAEICIPNQDAFRETLRMEPLPGHPKPRLAYARNFFGSLEDLARYWDSSTDQYYRVPVDKSDQGKQNGYATRHTSTAPVSAQGTLNETTKQRDEDKDVRMTNSDSTINDQTEDEQTKEVYRGYRYGNGDQAPAGSRVALVRNFLKIIMHKFGCRDHEPMPAPREKFTFRGVKVQSIQYHFSVAKIPSDAKQARARFVEGPLIAVSCREEARFKTETNPLSPQASLTGDKAGQDSKTVDAPKLTNGKQRPGFKSLPIPPRYDLLREVGCMLILADQRSRETRSKDSISGADKWWVTEKRWGGGPVKWGNLAMDLFEDEDPSWSPQEKELQEAKRQKALDEKNRQNGTDNSASTRTNTDVDTLMANNAPTIPGAPGDPILGPRKKKLRSLERPPGKEEELRDGRKVMYVPHFKKKWYLDWEKLRPNAPTWDDKVIYKQIGNPAGSGFDDVYMLTSVNHHIALVKMRVHVDYLDWVSNGKPVPKDNLDNRERRDVLDMQRSRWYDMFMVEDRKELLTVVWRLMCWLNRDSIDETEFERMAEKKQLQSAM